MCGHFLPVTAWPAWSSGSGSIRIQGGYVDRLSGLFLQDKNSGPISRQ